MEFAQLFIAQLTSILSITILILFLDNPYISKFSHLIYKIPFLTISDEKGLFLFVFLLYLIILISFIEIVRIYYKKNLALQERILYIQSCNFNNSFILFTNFLSIYIYKKLYFRTFNLLIYSLINSLLYNMAYLANFNGFTGFFYLNYLLANITNLMLTYVTNFDFYLNVNLGFLKGFLKSRFVN